MGNTQANLRERSRQFVDDFRSKWRPSTDLEWGYGREKGPDNWWVYYPAAAGTHQSPIDIDPEIAEFDSNYAAYPLKIAYANSSKKLLKNTGHGAQVDVDGAESYLFGGPLEGRYRLAQFHFHWGDKDDCGSEHTINQKAYSAELHLVHWNCEKYGSFKEATENSDGLAVLGVFLNVGNHNPYLAHITDRLSSIRYKKDSVDFDSEFNPNALLPVDCSKYWSYSGSLTTPPCLECVKWIVFFEPISVSPQQLHEFRSLNSYCRGENRPLFDDSWGQIVKNYRPVQPKGSRKISSIEHVFTTSKEIDEQFHKQALFTHTAPELECQFYRQGIDIHQQPVSGGHSKTQYGNTYGVTRTVQHRH